MQRTDSPVEHALRFLLERFESRTGAWTDFSTNRSGASDVWVTGYVLSRIGDRLPPHVVRQAASFLRGQRHATGGWGFNATTPPDCDSTTFALEALGENARGDSLNFLLRHRKPDGGFATYADRMALEKFRHYGPDNRYAGWTSEHACVTAEAVTFLFSLARPDIREQAEASLAWLATRQHPAGYWSAYWWHSRYYVLARLLPLLARRRNAAEDLAVSAALRWLDATRSRTGSWSNGIDTDRPCLLSTCWAIEALRSSGHDPAALRSTLGWILSRQDLDGGWTAEPCLRIPPPHVCDPDGTRYILGGRGVGAICRDDARIYGTVTAIAALCR